MGALGGGEVDGDGDEAGDGVAGVLRDVVLGVMEAVAGSGFAGRLPFHSLQLEGLFGGEEFASSLGAAAGPNLTHLAFTFPYATDGGGGSGSRGGIK